MNKDDLNFNLNFLPVSEGTVLGAGANTILSTMPFIFAHPNTAQLVFLLFSGIICHEMYINLKNRKDKNNNIAIKNNIKDYKNPAMWAFMCGLFGFQTLYFIPNAISNHQIVQILATLLSAGMFATSTIGLAKNIQHNKQQINNKTR